LRFLLKLPKFYTMFQKLVRGTDFYDDYVEKYIRPWPGCRILDVGCGPADLANYLSHDVDYTGLDANSRYIRAGEKKYTRSGAHFVCKPVRELTPDSFADFDIVVGTGVLHHLRDPEATLFFQLAKSWLSPGGRVVTLDGCYCPGQSLAALLLLKFDRGRHIRNEQGYRSLCGTGFRTVDVAIRHDMFRFPYSCIVFECSP
jgi:2-polyprenyl-3-methyl-5-hydroxy-6-metoxy-1,4-benzoquinol methylase